MSAVNSDPGTTAANEGLNLAPQRSEGGEEAKLRRMYDWLMYQIKAAKSQRQKVWWFQRSKYDRVIVELRAAAEVLVDIWLEE